MSYLTWFRGPHLDLYADPLVIAPHDLPVFAHALDLCRRLEELVATQAEAVARAAEQGRAAGHAEGWHAAQAQAEARLAALDRAAAAHHRQLERTVGALAVEVVRRIAPALGAGVVVAALAEQAAREVGEQVPMRVLRTHPDAAPAVQARLAETQPGLAVRADPALGAFDCEIDTAEGRVLAGLEVQLARTATALAAALQGALDPSAPPRAP